MLLLAEAPLSWPDVAFYAVINVPVAIIAWKVFSRP
jgi:hypothetical protein